MPMSARQLEGEIRALLCKAEIIDALEEGQHGVLTCGSTWSHAERAGPKRAKAYLLRSAKSATPLAPCSFCCGGRILRLFSICPLEE